MSKVLYLKQQRCERCNCLMDDDLNATPFGKYYCEDCIGMDDVFPDDMDLDDEEE